MIEDLPHTMFTRDLSDPGPIPQAGIDRAVELMRTGRLTRYGEAGGEPSEVSLLEEEFAALIGSRYAVAVNSGASAIRLALWGLGVRPGDGVLLNAFTLAPVPGAVEGLGARTLLVECTDACVIDIDDLERKAARGDARVLLLSHMRGHIADMGAVLEVCRRHEIMLVEDCAHTLGAAWDGRPSGSFGVAGCFSAQSYKHLNSGEGGLLITDDEDLAAQAVLLSGSYMFYESHRSRPPLEVFERHRGTTPNLSLRMTNLAAALIRPQLSLLDERIADWNGSYDDLAERLGQIEHVSPPKRDPRESYVGSSIQFALTGLGREAVEAVLAACDRRGVHIKWFGRADARGFTHTWRHWGYVADDGDLPATGSMLAALCDMRIPLGLTDIDRALLTSIVAESVASVTA